MIPKPLTQAQVKDLMAKAFATLDALSNFHFTPKVLLLFVLGFGFRVSGSGLWGSGTIAPLQISQSVTYAHTSDEGRGEVRHARRSLQLPLHSQGSHLPTYFYPHTYLGR